MKTTILSNQAYFTLAIKLCKRHLATLKSHLSLPAYKHDYAHYTACLKRLEQHDLFTAHAIFYQLTMATNQRWTIYG